ncbi:MAG: hypothetical protein AAB911_01485, partial [Patescibacteria group bacterium]
MENNRIIIILSSIILTVGIFVSAPYFVFAYSKDTTHPALTDEIIDFYNLHYSNKQISDSEKNLVVRGSIDEDNFARPLYHFYDPVYNRGLAFAGSWSSSKEWATNHELQAKYDPKMTALAAVVKPFEGSTDYSWERSIYEYAWGDKNRGLVGLGHILHLLEDATVPDHTRNDPHPPIWDERSPYEYFVSRFTDMSIGNGSPVVLGSIGEYLDVITKYSNNNFFSKDTILSREYSFPYIVEKRVEKLSDGQNYLFGYGRDTLGNIFRLVNIKGISEWRDPEYSLSDNDNKVLSDYWFLLSKQAVLNGAGVVKLFFDEVEKEKKTKVLLAYNKSPAERAIGAIIRTFLSPALRQANQEPEYREDLDLPTPPLRSGSVPLGASIVSFVEPVGDGINGVEGVKGVETGTEGGGNVAVAPQLPQNALAVSPPTSPSTPVGTSNTSPAMPIA